jgi:hypothetical protein
MMTEYSPSRMEWNVVSMGDLFDKKELRAIRELINKGDKEGLRKFLNEREEKLKEKGVLPDYLYYYLEFTFKKKLKDVM